MKRRALSRLLALILATALAYFPSAAAACTACMGDASSKHAGAMNAAIFLLLGCIGGVLGLLVAFGISLMKRAAAPLPPASEFTQNDSDHGTDS
jgi:hypothetical protein